MVGEREGESRVWWYALAAPPILFLAVIVALSVYFGVVTRGDARAVAENATRSAPYVLLIVQVLMLMVIFGVMRAEGLAFRDVGWRLFAGQKVWREALIGVLVGSPLGFLYIFVLSPLLATVQRVVGDYVPPEQILPTLESAVIPFFVANVVLAPFVEETVYRGYAIPRLSRRFGVSGAVLISCSFFGLLHWTGGLWYVVLTGVVAGGVLASLFVWRCGIVAAYAAHLALNLVEFLLVWHTR